MDEQGRDVGMREIWQYIEGLKFKRTLIWGFNPVDVYEKLAELQRLYSAHVHELEIARGAASELEAVTRENARLRQELEALTGEHGPGFREDTGATDAVSMDKKTERPVGLPANGSQIPVRITGKSGPKTVRVRHAK